MMARFGSKRGVRSITASLAIALLAATGCHPEEEAPTSAPTSPLPTSDSSRPEQPPPPRIDQGGETKAIGQLGRDLRKDQAESLIRPDGPTTYFPPAGKPERTVPDDSTKPGRP